MASVDDDNSNSNLTNSSASNISSASQQSSVNLKSSMLRPSALSWNSSSTLNAGHEGINSNSSSSLPAASSNPFAKVLGGEENGRTGEKDAEAKGSAEKENKGDPLSLLSRNGLPKSNLFNTSNNPISTSNTGFVFGQNLHERVTGSNIDAKDAEGKADSDEKEPSGNDAGASNSGLFFSTAAQQQSTSASNSHNSQKSLTEVAREYEESRAQKRKYEEVETFTGEEDEKNILDINCKLFTFTSSTWEERGRGSLRLNDPKCGGASATSSGISRVVFRAAGSHRVLLNTKIWHEMVAERASQKSMRLTAIDSSGQIKVYLVMARPCDIDTLYMALQRRIDIEVQRKPPVHSVVQQQQPEDDKIDLSQDACEPPASPTDDDDEASSNPEHGELSPKKKVITVNDVEKS